METQVEEEINIKEKIRLSLDGNWLAADVIDLFGSLQNLYNYYTCIFLIRGLSRSFRVDEIQCIGYLNQKVLNKSTTFIDTHRRFYYFDRDYNQRETLSLDSFSPLRLIKYQYSSPGFSDFTGLGQVVGHLKELCFKLIDLHSNRDKKKLEEEKLKLENQLLEIERNKRFIEVLESVGFDKEDIKTIIHHEFQNSMMISKLIEENKITDVQ